MADSVNDLNKYQKNPRKISASQQRILAKGLETYGDLSGVVFNVRNKQLVGGNQRTDFFNKSDQIHIVEKFNDPDSQGTIAFGYIEHDGKKYSYREVDWDEKTHAAACLIANKAGGDFDWGLVKDVTLYLDDGAFDMELTGFDNVELENLLSNTLEIKEKQGATELSEKDFQEFNTVCPKCGFEYDSKNKELENKADKILDD